MKFTVTTASDCYPKSDRDRIEKLGFELLPPLDASGMWYDMADSKQSVEVEINSLEELLAFVKKHGRIVLTDNEIKLYDDYLE